MAQSQNSVIVVGGGHAAGQFAASLRQLGHASEIVIVADEEHIPYQRPPLSKQYLQGKYGLERVYLRQRKFYSDKNIQCITGRRVEEISTTRNTVLLDDGQHIQWDTLVLATGSSNRVLEIDGAVSPQTLSLRSIGDCDALKTHLTSDCKVAIVGGGYIGLEVASSCRSLGYEVTVVELLDRVLARVTLPEISKYFRELHESQGVKILTGAVVQSINLDRGGNVSGLLLEGGRQLPADVVLIGVGITPNVDLAVKANLPVDNGIVVDEYCRTAHERIYAIGDCTNQHSELLGRRIRLESVPNAMEQARCAAATIAGTPTPNHSIPWFWSDQYDVKFQMAGFPMDGETTVLRGDIDAGSFMHFHLANGCLMGASALNTPGEFLIARRLVGKRIEPSVLADVAVDLRTLA